MAIRITAINRPLLATMILAAACGGDKDPVKPPEGGDPASLAIHAGNGQSAGAGSAVAVNPAVIVRDAAGNPVSGVGVQFAITQGGGSLGSTSARTNQGGIASPGQWTLGPNAGPQGLRASLTSGTIAAVNFTATATPDDDGDGDELITQTIPSGGGTITINAPGSALHGTSLEFENGALGSATSLTLTEESTAGLQIPAGMAAVGPALGIGTTAGRLQAGAVVRLPMTQVAGKVMMIGFADPVSRRVTVLPTLRQESDEIAALIPSLDGGTIPGARIAGVSGPPARTDEPKSVYFLMAINEELLDRPFDTGFRPGADDWDFPRMAIADLAFLKRPSDAGLPFATVDDGLVSTAIWYYVNRRKQGGQPLHGSTQLYPQQPLSSRYGIRWAAIAERDVPSINQTGGLLVKEWGEWADEDRGHFLWLQFQGIKALMLTTFERPVPVVLLDTDNPDEFNTESHPMAIAYRTDGNTLYLAWPGSPGSEIAVQFTEQGMTPFLLPNENGTANMVRAIGGIHYVNVIDDAKLAAQWTRVANETIGDAEGWPVPELHWEKAELDTARTYLLDELQHWWQCAECPDKVPTPPQLPASASRVQRFRTVSIRNGAVSTGYSSLRLDAEDVGTGDESLAHYGFMIFNPVEADSWVGTAISWLDWRTVTYRKLTIEPSVEDITFAEDTTINISVTPSETPPTGTRYRWLLRTADSQDSVETTTPAHTRELEAGTEGWLIFSALEGEHKRPIARDSIRVSPSEGGPYWRVTSFTGTEEFLESIDDSEDDDESEIEEIALLKRALAAPNSAMLALVETGATTQLQLRVRKSTLWTDALCCPPPAFNGSVEWLLPLGSNPPIVQPVGPYFAGWETTHFNQTSESLDEGVMTGQYVPTTVQYPVSGLGIQTGPAGGFRIVATRDGDTVSGTISLYMWWLEFENEEDDTPEVENPPEVFVFQFTATRGKPD